MECTGWGIGGGGAGCGEWSAQGGVQEGGRVR